MSALSVTGWMLRKAEYNSDDLGLCRMSNCFQYTGEYLRRMFALLIFWLRLNALIGPVYPKWVRYPALLPIFAWIIALPLVLNIEYSDVKGSFVDDDDVCRDQRYISYHYVFDTCVVAVLFEGLSSIGYLVLFVMPLLKYGDDVLGRAVRKHVLIAAVEIVVQLLLITIIMANDSSSRSLKSASLILYTGLTLNNVILIFVFNDWRKYICVRNVPKFKCERTSRASTVPSERLSIQSNSLQTLLLLEIINIPNVTILNHTADTNRNADIPSREGHLTCSGMNNGF